MYKKKGFAALCDLRNALLLNIVLINWGKKQTT